ncbi:hypothetical protein Hanom_Chr09g00767091 [Helianthus anomalus]
MESLSLSNFPQYLTYFSRIELTIVEKVGSQYQPVDVCLSLKNRRANGFDVDDTISVLVLNFSRNLTNFSQEPKKCSGSLSKS